MAALTLFLLGSPRLELDGQNVNLSRRKALALLAYLALTGQAHRRETLAAFFWPEFDQSSAYAYLRTMLWTLNKAIGDEWLQAERELVSLKPGFEVDVNRFRERVASPDTPALTEAAVLYQGDFMAGFALPDSPEFDEWQLFQRETLRRELGEALQKLAARLGDQGDYENAVIHARRWLALDALNEPAHRQLMRLYFESGQRAAALRQYQECVAILRRELGVEPEAETTELFRAMQAGRAAISPKPVTPPTMMMPTAPPQYTLPAQTTAFVGREVELDDIARLLADPNCRLLTLIGPGGIGKTRLSLQAASRLISQYEHGACFVPLAPVSRAEYVLPALADALNFSLTREGDPKEQLLCYLAAKRLLLVLDNFEHVLDSAEAVAEILRAAPGVTILASSRERLGLQEEWLYEIQGLSYPQDAASCDFDECDAVQLFLQNARRVQPHFKLHEADKPAIARICQLVEGMPLGIELAAAWLQVLSPQEVAAEIERSLDFLAASVRNLPPRHRSLRLVFETSWERLSPMEQRVLCKLAIFRGGFEREAAQAVADASLPLLLALVSKSLVRRTPAGRFEMHELLRQFAEEKLAGEERERATHLHSVYYAGLVQAQEPRLKGGDQLGGLDVIEAEIGNVLAAWQRAASYYDQETLKRLLPGLEIFYIIRPRPFESKELAAWALDHYQTRTLTEDERILVARLQVWKARSLMWFDEYTPAHALIRSAETVLRPLATPELALALMQIGMMYMFPGSLHHEEGRRWVERALKLFQEQGDGWGEAQALREIGFAYHHLIHYVESQEYFQQNLDISRRIGDLWGEGEALKALGEVAYTLGHYPEAEDLYRQGVELSETVGNDSSKAWGLARLSEIIGLCGRYDESMQVTEQSIRLYQQLGIRSGLAWQQMQAAWLLLVQEQFAEAERLLMEVLAVFQTNSDGNGLIWTHHHLSDLKRLTGYPQEAYQLAAESLAMAERRGSPWEQSGAYYRMGEAKLALGEIEEAQQHLRWSIMLAAGAKSRMMLLIHLVGVARLWAHTGQPERAAELLAFISSHHAAWYSTKTEAERLLKTLPLSAEARATAAERSRSWQLETIVPDVAEALL